VYISAKTECAQTDTHTDRQTDKSETVYLPVSLFHLADIITMVCKYWPMFYPHIHRSSFCTSPPQQQCSRTAILRV